MSFRSAVVLLLGLAFLTLAAKGGCLSFSPQANRIGISPDGKTLYLSLNADGEIPFDASSALYALDVEKCRLKALSGETNEWGVFSVSPDGKALLFGQGTLMKAAAVMDIEDGQICLLGVPDRPKLFARFVPGDSRRILAAELEVKDNSEYVLHWVMLSERGRVQFLPDDYVAASTVAAAFEGKIVFAVAKASDVRAAEGREKPEVKVELYAVDVSGNKPGAPVCVARWSGKGQRQPIVSRDGRHIAIVQPYDGVFEEGGKVWEVSPLQADQQKVLFEDRVSAVVEFTPEASDVVYATTPDDAGRVEIRLWDEATGKQRLLARYAAEGEEQSPPTFRWINDKRLQVVAPSADGLRIIETNLDGTGAEARLLPLKSLRVQRHLADIEWTLDHAAGVAIKLRPKQPLKPVRMEKKDGKPVVMEPAEPRRDPEIEKEIAEARATVAPFYDLMKARDAELRKQIEVEWDKVDDWEKVPVLPDIPKPEPGPDKAK